VQADEQIALQESTKGKASAAAPSQAPAENDDPLAGFFSELGAAASSVPAKKRDEKALTEVYQKANLGTDSDYANCVLKDSPIIWDLRPCLQEHPNSRLPGCCRITISGKT
jgi:hypothetical protein